MEDWKCVFDSREEYNRYERKDAHNNGGLRIWLMNTVALILFDCDLLGIGSHLLLAIPC